MLTGNDGLETAFMALELGAKSYITKPFEANVIREAVLSVLAAGEGGKKTSDKPWHVKKAGE
jgi:DNA-binding response OmpR family regulator